jgi:excisionase family DNA binding protein
MIPSAIRSFDMAALLTIAEFSTHAHVSKRTTARWLAAGLIPGRRIGSRTVRIPASALETVGEPIIEAAI